MSPHDRISLPGENFVNESKVIENIVRDLAPELLENPAVLLVIKAFILPVPNRPAPSFSHLRSSIKKSLDVKSQHNLDTLLQVLQGAVYFRDSFGLESFPAFDQQMEIRRQEALETIFGDEGPMPMPEVKLHGRKK